MSQLLSVLFLGLPLLWASRLAGAEATRLATVDARGVLRWQDDGKELALFGVNYYAPFWHNYPDLKAVGARYRQVIRVPLDSLRHWAHWGVGPPGRGGEGDGLHPSDLAGVNVCFGAWLYPGRADELHSIELESVTVE